MSAQISYWIRRTALAHQISHKHDESTMKRRPSAEERRETHWIVFAFSFCVGIVDGTKQIFFQSCDKNVQQETYEGQI